MMDSSLYFTLYSDVYVCGETGFVFVGPLVFCYRTSGAGVSFWVNGFYIVWNKMSLNCSICLMPIFGWNLDFQRRSMWMFVSSFLPFVVLWFLSNF